MKVMHQQVTSSSEISACAKVKIRCTSAQFQVEELQFGEEVHLSVYQQTIRLFCSTQLTLQLKKCAIMEQYLEILSELAITVLLHS